MDDLYVSKQLAEGLLQTASGAGLGGGFETTLLEMTQTDHTTIPYVHYAKLYEHCIQMSADHLFGLHEGEKYGLTALGIVGQIIQVSSNVQEAVEKCCDYFNLISNILNVDLAINAHDFTLRFNVNPLAEKAFPLATEHMLLSSMVFASRELLFLNIKNAPLLDVRIGNRSNDVLSFEQVFGCPVELNSNVNTLRYDKTILQRRIIYADFELLKVLEKVACARIQAIKEKNHSLSSTISSLIHHLLNPAIPSFTTVAANLNMSPRNLQRRLRSEGTSYSKIVEAVKKDLVLEYLKQDISVKEISYLMGYSEPSSFVASFKKWFGSTPAKYRMMM